MADDNAAELIKRGDRRFSKRAQLDSFRQEVALNFAPWLAEWTGSIQWGEDFASHLADSTPILLARDFVGQIGAMLRPPGKQWFWHRSSDDDINEDPEVRDYLEWRSKRMMRIMTDRVTGLLGAAKQADTFFGLFGDACMSIDLSANRDSLRFANYHTANVIWGIGSENRADVVTRKEKIEARVFMQRFRQPGDKIHPKVKEAYDKDPDTEINIRHEVIPASEYDSYRKPLSLPEGMHAKWMSVWVDVDNKAIIRETPQQTMRYVAPRWVTLSGQPYAISPATTIALPDARLIQQQALAILDAAEKSISPPLIATMDAIRGDVQLTAGGITWIDREYDERKGDGLKALETGKNFQLGVESLLRTERQITRAFYLDTLRPVDTRRTKTREEAQFAIDEYVRAALPLFAPMQDEYNSAMLHEADEIIALTGGYEGREPPKKLKAAQIVFAWDNPLSEMMERQKAQTVAEVSQLGNAVAALEAAASQAPSLQRLNTGKMFTTSVVGIGGASWLLTDDEAEQKQQAATQGMATQAAVAAAPNIAKLIDSGVNAAQVASTIPNPAEPGYALPMPV